MDELRAAYLAALSDQQRPYSEKLDDVRIADVEDDAPIVEQVTPDDEEDDE